MDTFKTLVGCLPCSFEDDGRGNLIYTHEASHSEGSIKKKPSGLGYTTGSRPSLALDPTSAPLRSSETFERKSLPFFAMLTGATILVLPAMLGSGGA